MRSTFRLDVQSLATGRRLRCFSSLSMRKWGGEIRRLVHASSDAAADPMTRRTLEETRRNVGDKGGNSGTATRESLSEDSITMRRLERNA